MQSMIRVDTEKLIGPTGPLVVVDRCVLLQRVDQFIPKDAEVVVPDVYLREALGAGDPCEFHGFNKWTERHSPTIWVAKATGQLMDADVAASVPLPRQEVIDVTGTMAFRDCARTGGLDWSGVNVTEDDTAARQNFIETCSSCTSIVDVEVPNWRQELEAAGGVVQWVRQPGLVVPIAQKLDPRLADDRWVNLLDVFPDVLAAGRLARCVIWYTLMHMHGRTRKFGNNWEDAQYAVTASYVGRLATQDEGLIDLVEALFPNCQIFSERILPA